MPRASSIATSNLPTCFTTPGATSSWATLAWPSSICRMLQRQLRRVQASVQGMKPDALRVPQGLYVLQHQLRVPAAAALAENGKEGTFVL